MADADAGRVLAFTRVQLFVAGDLLDFPLRGNRLARRGRRGCRGRGNRRRGGLAVVDVHRALRGASLRRGTQLVVVDLLTNDHPRLGGCFVGPSPLRSRQLQFRRGVSIGRLLLDFAFRDLLRRQVRLVAWPEASSASRNRWFGRRCGRTSVSAG